MNTAERCVMWMIMAGLVSFIAYVLYHTAINAMVEVLANLPF